MATRNPRDGNFIPTLRAALNTDGVTIMNVCANPVTHALCISDGTTGTDHGTTNAQRDKDFHADLMAVSSSGYITPVEVYADSGSKLLVKST